MEFSIKASIQFCVKWKVGEHTYEDFFHSVKMFVKFACNLAQLGEKKNHVKKYLQFYMGSCGNH